MLTNVAFCNISIPAGESYQNCEIIGKLFIRRNNGENDISSKTFMFRQTIWTIIVLYKIVKYGQSFPYKPAIHSVN